MSAKPRLAVGVDSRILAIHGGEYVKHPRCGHCLHTQPSVRPGAARVRSGETPIL